MYNHRRELHNSQFENARLLFHLLMAPSFLVFGIRYRKSWSRNCRFRKIRSIPPSLLPFLFYFFFFGKYKNYFLYRKNFKWQDNLVFTLLINYAIIIDNDISPRKKFLTIHQKYNWTLNALVCSFFPRPKEPNLSKIPTGQKTSPYGVCV